MKPVIAVNRAATTPAAAVVLTLALIAVAASSTAATPAPRSADARHLSNESAPTRLVAAAVAAARDILRLDRASVVALVLVPAERAPAMTPLTACRMIDRDQPHEIQLDERLLDLPPPIC